MSLTAEFGPVFSPDVRWIAYQSDESGRDEIYVRSFPASGGRVRVSTKGGRARIWPAGGRELFFRHGSAVMSAAVTLQSSFHAETPQDLLEGQFQAPSTGGNPYYDVSRDGRRFVMLEVADATKEKQLYVVLHAVEEIRRLTEFSR